MLEKLSPGKDKKMTSNIAEKKGFVFTHSAWEACNASLNNQMSRSVV